MEQKIRAVKQGRFVSNDGPVNSPVFLTKMPDELQLSRYVMPPDTIATIKGDNGLYINIRSMGEEGYLVWSHEPREFKFTFGFAGVHISTVHDGVEPLYWSIMDEPDKLIYLNRQGSLFHVG